MKIQIRTDSNSNMDAIDFEGSIEEAINYIQSNKEILKKLCNCGYSTIYDYINEEYDVPIEFIVIKKDNGKKLIRDIYDAVIIINDYKK